MRELARPEAELFPDIGQLLPTFFDRCNALQSFPERVYALALGLLSGPSSMLSRPAPSKAVLRPVQRRPGRRRQIFSLRPYYENILKLLIFNIYLSICWEIPGRAGFLSSFNNCQPITGYWVVLS